MPASPSQDQRARAVSPPLRVVLADREGAARRAVSGLLGGLAGVVLADVAGDRTELAVALDRAPVDVLVIDDRLLGDAGQVLAGLGLDTSGVRVLVLGVDDAPAFAARARRLGAEEWIAKDRADERLSTLLGR